jgi:Protein of unknown function DUF262
VGMIIMTEQQISLKSVNDLRLDTSEEQMRFYIPAYQRGYRWSPLQVEQLLEDIREFTVRRNPQPEEFYCLQPLVVKIRPRGDFEVVDGQQRLTTLLLILKHFNERLAKKYQQQIYSLTYETRPSLDVFLDDPTDERAAENIDFFHLYQAIQTIEQWFGERESEVETIKSALLNQTKVIWFQLAEIDNPVDAFTRLNVGKIPLTNDELIRALFLRCIGPDEKETTSTQLRIAYEWDQLEKSLQSDDFWYFLSNSPGKEQNRIGFLFDLVAWNQGVPKGAENDAYSIFYTFNERLKTPKVTPEGEWRKIKQTYLMLEEWFEDRVLYHMIGFLVNECVSINFLRALSMDCTKSEFELRLRQEIYRRMIDATLSVPFDEQAIREQITNQLDTLSYKNSRQKVRSLLLLFNLVTLLQNKRSNLRFQFDSFKSKRWDIEHVRSVADDKPVRQNEQRQWLNNCLGYLELQNDAEQLREEIRSFIELTQSESNDDIFDSLYDKVLEYFHETYKEENADHRIANLTFLDENTNRSYKNAVFAIKRQRILNLDQAGIFVPLCTRNVFLKCYSPQVDNVMFWSEADRDGYEEAIISALVNFFCGKMEGIQ